MSPATEELREREKDSRKRTVRYGGFADDDVIGYIREKVSEEENKNSYIVSLTSGIETKVVIPSEMHYSIGDGVLGRHVYNTVCINCGNDKFYDERNNEWYCPKCEEC